jgi:hypothetical protein
LLGRIELVSHDIEPVEYFKLAYLGKITVVAFAFVIIVVGEILVSL